jgi:hypothetical protein
MEESGNALNGIANFIEKRKCSRFLLHKNQMNYTILCPCPASGRVLYSEDPNLAGWKADSNGIVD